MKLINTPPDTIRDAIALYFGKDEDILIPVAGDVKDEHSFGETWIVITQKKVLLIGPGKNKEIEVKDIPLASLIGQQGQQ